MTRRRRHKATIQLVSQPVVDHLSCTAHYVALSHRVGLQSLRATDRWLARCLLGSGYRVGSGLCFSSSHCRPDPSACQAHVDDSSLHCGPRGAPPFLVPVSECLHHRSLCRTWCLCACHFGPCGRIRSGICHLWPLQHSAVSLFCLLRRHPASCFASLCSDPG